MTVYVPDRKSPRVSSHAPGQPGGAAWPRARSRAVVTFAGQGVDVLDELAALVAQRPELRRGVELATDVLCATWRPRTSRGAAAPTGTGSTWPRGCMDPDGAPPLAYLRGAAVSYPLQPARAGAAVARAVGRRARAAVEPARSSASRGIRRACSRRCWSPRRRAAGRRRAARAAPASARRCRALHMARRRRALADGGDRGRHARAAGAAARPRRIGRAGQHADAARRRWRRPRRSTRCGPG